MQQFTNTTGGFGGQYIGTWQQFADAFREQFTEWHQDYLYTMTAKGIVYDALILDEYIESHLTIHLDPAPEGATLKNYLSL